MGPSALQGSQTGRSIGFLPEGINYNNDYTKDGGGTILPYMCLAAGPNLYLPTYLLTDLEQNMPGRRPAHNLLARGAGEHLLHRTRRLHHAAARPSRVEVAWGATLHFE